MSAYFPFEIFEVEGSHIIRVVIEEPDIFTTYVDFFEQFGYSGNGYTWEGIVTHVLENIDPELIDYIDFDSEADAFYATADSKASQLKFVDLLTPIFSDLKKLEVFVKSADRSEIDD